MHINSQFKKVESYGRQIDRLMAEGDLEKAEEICNELLSDDDKCVQAFCKLGEIYEELDRVVEASFFIDKAKKLKDAVYDEIIKHVNKKEFENASGLCALLRFSFPEDEGLLKVEEMLSGYLGKTGTPEKEDEHNLEESAGNSDISTAVILDIGAHNGQSLERLYESYRQFGNVEIHSFEPIPENYLCLRNTAEELMSRFSNLRVHCYNFAMDKESKLAPFYCYGMHDLESNQYSSLLPFKEKEEWLKLLPDQPHQNLALTKIIVVPCHTGAEFCNILNITEIEYLKIDTQGNDFNVLKGIEELLKKKSIKTIEAECQEIELYKGGATFSEIENFLSGYGYEKEKIDYQASGLEYVVRYVLKDETGPEDQAIIKDVNVISDAGNLSEPVIDLLIPDFFASWNASEGWINAIKRAGRPGNILRPKQDNHQFVFDYLKDPRADMMLMLSFDHHTPYLHMNEEYRDIWRQSPITKVLIAEETVIQDCYPDNVKKSESALECIDAVFYSSLSDRNFYSNFDTPYFWLPFGVDEEKFANRIPFQSRSGRPYFRGKTKPIGLPNTYERRRQLLKLLLERDLVDFKEFEYIDSVDQLVDEFNRYKISINLPAVFQGFTTRVFESMACGCTLISPRPVQEEELNLFSDNYHLLYYDENNPEEFLRKIEYTVNDFESAENIAAQGYYEVLSKHTLVNRLQVILNKLDVLNLSKAEYAST